MLTPEEAIEGIHDRYGSHPGFRALHAKGTLCVGTFTATAEAAGLTRAAHMQGEPVAVTVRVSNAGGDPGVPDYAPDVRGLAVSFHLPDGTRTDIVAQTAPRFPVKTPEAFIDLVRAQKQPQAVWRMPLLLARHPRIGTTLPANLPALRPPESYATCRYYAIHAYRWVAADGSERYARYTWLPEAGDVRISNREAKKRGRDYLQEEIADRLSNGPARFTLELQIADSGDDPDDPTAVWPSDRQTVDAGTLELTALEEGQASDGHVFDPVRVTDGIELSGDPILNYRPLAYSASAGLRLS